MSKQQNLPKVLDDRTVQLTIHLADLLLTKLILQITGCQHEVQTAEYS